MQDADTTARRRLPSIYLLAFPLLFVAEMSVCPLYSQQPYGELSPARVQNIAEWIPSQPSGFGRVCSDRAAWSEQSSRLTNFLDAAQQAILKPVPAFDEEAYLQYTRTGDRQPMEKKA